MRTSAGPIVFAAAVAVTVILAAAAAASLALIVSTPSLAQRLSAHPSNPWWFSYRDAPARDPAQPVAVIAAALAASVTALGAAFRANAFYHKSRVPVLPYLMLFLFALGPECLRAPLALLVASDRSIPAAIVLTRVVWGARFAGLLALLLASLSCIELKYRRAYVLGGGALLVAFAIAAYIPIDRTVFLSELVWKLGDEQGVWFVNLVISVLVLAAAVGGALIKRNGRYVALAGGFLFLLAARELLFFGVHPIRLAAAMAALVAGIVVSLRTLSAVSAV